MKIRFLFFETCPSYKEAFANLTEVLKEEDVYSEIEMIDVTSEDKAKEYKFLGSPTIYIDGNDIAGGNYSNNDYGLKCRLYNENGKISGVPSKELIRKAIKNALSKK